MSWIYPNEMALKIKFSPKVYADLKKFFLWLLGLGFVNMCFIAGEVDKHNFCQALAGQFTFWGAIPNLDVTLDKHAFLASHFQIQHLASKVVLFENMAT